MRGEYFNTTLILCNIKMSQTRAIPIIARATLIIAAARPIIGAADNISFRTCFILYRKKGVCDNISFRTNFILY